MSELLVLGLAIPPLVQLCVSLGRDLIQIINAYRNSDAISEEIALKIETKWGTLQKILHNLDRVSSRLNIDLEIEIRPILTRLLEILMKAREKAAKLEMKRPQEVAQSVEVIAPVALKFRKTLFTAALCWSQADLRKILSQCEEWESLISSRLLIIILFETTLLNNNTASPMSTVRIPRLQPTDPQVKPSVVSNYQIFSTWSAGIDEIILKDSDFTITRLQRSDIRYFIPVSSVGEAYLVESLSPETVLGDTNYDTDFNHAQSNLYSTARMLKGAVPQLMNILQSPGIRVYNDSTSRMKQLELIYTISQEIGGQTKTPPRSLRDLLSTSVARYQDEDKGDLLIPLNHRIRLANRVATAILYVHSGYFVHKRIKPENIIIFDNDANCTFPISIGQPFLTGFIHSRLDTGHTNLEGDLVPEDCIYQHPERWGIRAEHKYSMLHDVYSLGVVLLEIGLWKTFVKWDRGSLKRTISWKAIEDLCTVAKMKEAGTPKEVQQRLIDKAGKLLPSRMGQRYTDVVVACLSGSINAGIEPDQQDAGARVGLAYIKVVMSRLERLYV